MDLLELDVFGFMNNLLVWVGLLLVFTLIELLTYQFFALCFSFGSVSALVVSLFDVGIMGQIVAFLVVSSLLIVFIRPIAYKMLKVDHRPTNSDMLIGKEGIVIAEINNLEKRGRVNILGQDWAAKNAIEKTIQVNTKVVVKKIEGVTLVVEANE